MTLEEMEKRFCECTKLNNISLVHFPIHVTDFPEQKQETIEELNKKFAFVPTPVYLVDRMVEMNVNYFDNNSTTCDLAAGCGQYTIRLLRYLKNKFDIDVEQFLTNNHYLTELQPENCAALVYTFGTNINLYVGDSMNLKYSDENDKGILFFDEKNKKWFNDTLIDKLLVKETFNSNREFLSYLFNNYKDKNKIIEYVNKIKNGEIVAKPKEEKQVEVITVEKIPEVVKQIKEQDKPKEEVKVVKETKPKKQATTKKKGIGNNTKEEADDFFGMFGGLKPLKGA